MAVLGAGRARLRVRSERREQLPPPVRASGPPEHEGRALGKVAAGLTAVAVVSLTSFAGDFSPPPALAETLTVAFRVSKAREVNRVQTTLVEAWGLIREAFVDPTFNHQDIPNSNVYVMVSGSQGVVVACWTVGLAPAVAKSPLAWSRQ